MQIFFSWLNVHITHWCDHLCIQLIIWIGKYRIFCSNHPQNLMQNSFFLKITPLEHNGKSCTMKWYEEKCCTLLLRSLFLFSRKMSPPWCWKPQLLFLHSHTVSLLSGSHHWLGSIMLKPRMPKELNIKQETTATKIDVDHKVTMSHNYHEPAVDLSSEVQWSKAGVTQDRTKEHKGWRVSGGSRITELPHWKDYPASWQMTRQLSCNPWLNDAQKWGFWSHIMNSLVFFFSIFFLIFFS